jgi:type I restriction enzyme S subunit
MSTAYVALAEIATINPQASRTLTSEMKLALLPMAAVSAEQAEVKPTGNILAKDVKTGLTYFEDGDIVFAKITPCFENGKIALVNTGGLSGFGSTEFHIIRAREQVDRRYLVHFVRQHSIRLAGEKRMTGSAGQKRVPRTFLEQLRVPLPPLEEQKRIAAILDQADALRRLRQKALDRLNTLSQAIFYEMFGDGTGFDRFPLKALGKISTGSTPPTGNAENFGGSIPFVTPGDLGSREPIKRSLTEAGAMRSRTVNAGATFVCCIGTIGKMGQATERSAFNQQINAIEWGGKVDPNFGFFAMQQIRSVLVHKGKGNSTTLPILKKSEFEKIELFCPSLDQQIAFSQRVKAVQKNITHYNHLNALADKLFTSLQHRAFNGEI